MFTTTGTQLSDRLPALPRFKGLNKITKQHHTINTTGTQLSDRLPASPRFKGLNKIT